MHFLECLDLAQHINRTRPSWTILAIGRFVKHTEIRLGMSWGISVMEPEAEKPRVIWRREDLDCPANPDVGTETTTSVAAMTAAPEGMLF